MKVEIVNGMIHATSSHLPTDTPAVGEGILSMGTQDYKHMLERLARHRLNYVKITPMIAGILLAVGKGWCFTIQTIRNGIVAPDSETRQILSSFRNDASFGKGVKIKDIGSDIIRLKYKGKEYFINLNDIQKLTICDHAIEAMRIMTIDFTMTQAENLDNRTTESVIKVELRSRSFKLAKYFLRGSIVPYESDAIEVETEPAKLMENIYLVDNPFKLATLLREQTIPCYLERNIGENIETIFEGMRQGIPYVASLCPVFTFSHKNRTEYEVSLLSLPEFQAEVKSVTPKRP